MTRSQKVAIFLTAFAASVLLGFSVSKSSQVLLTEYRTATANAADCPSEHLIGYADVPRGWTSGAQGNNGLVLELVCMTPEYQAPAP